MKAPWPALSALSLSDFMAISCSIRRNPDAVQRVESAIESGLQGVCFFPAMHRYSMHDDCALAVLEVSGGRQGIVVFVHCGVLSVGIRAKMGLSSRFRHALFEPDRSSLHRIAFPRI